MQIHHTLVTVMCLGCSGGAHDELFSEAYAPDVVEGIDAGDVAAALESGVVDAGTDVDADPNWSPNPDASDCTVPSPTELCGVPGVGALCGFVADGCGGTYRCDTSTWCCAGTGLLRRVPLRIYSLKVVL